VIHFNSAREEPSRVYGNASQYMKILEANKDKISDPDKMKVGQELLIPD